MRILLHTHVYWPSLGGIETVSDVLAEHLTRQGHDCVVLTESGLDGRAERERPFRIVRRPGWRERLRWARWADIVHANGATMALYPYARWAGRPFVWTHNGYQVSCVDGLGWCDGASAPMTPWASLRFHARRSGVPHALREAVKLGLRRHIAHRVELNLAGSRWVAQRQPLPRQLVAYNPYPLDRFRAARPPAASHYDFGYVGRLVGEKGVDTLIEATRLLVTSAPEGSAASRLRLAIVGGGELRESLEARARAHGLDDHVDFLGPRQGDALVETMADARVGIVPSAWEEPYGGVTLEWLAAGRSVIVSEQGGHAECAGEAGLRFPNRNARALADCMALALADPALIERQRERARDQVEAFGEARLTRHYVACYERAIRQRALRVAPA